MTSFGYRFNPRYAIKECSSYGTLYTRDCGCSKGNVEDKILVPKPHKNCARCTRCGYLVDGPNCQRCALLQQELEENPDHGSFIDKIIFDLNRAPDSPNQFHCFHCKDVLRDGEACKRCTCVKCRSGLGKGLCYICGHNQNSLKDSLSISETSSQILRISTIVAMSVTIDELPQTLPIFHLTFQSEAESPFTLDSTPTYVDEYPNVFNPPPQSLVYPCEFGGNDAYYGHYCTPQAPFIYPEPCYNQDFNFPQDFQNVPQQYLFCDDYGVTHDAYQCQPMSEVYYYGQNSCYDSTSIGFDQSQPQQYTVDHPIFNAHNSYLDSQIQLNKEKQIEEERAAKAKYWKLPVCYDDDDDEERCDSLDDNIISGLPLFSAITPNEPVLSTEEPDNSLSMGDEHLDTIPATKSDEFIKSGVETLIPIPSESEGIPEHVCDVPFHDNSPPLDVSKDQFEDFSESNEEFSSINDDSFSIDDIDYVEASPPDSELVSLEVMEIVIPEETNTFYNSLPEFKTFCFDVEEISSGSTTTPPDISLPEYEVFHDDHVKEISSGNPTTHSDSSLYASFIFYFSTNPFPPTDRSDSYEFIDELIPFISPPEYDCFLFKVELNSRDFTKDVVELNSRDFTKDVVEDISLTKEPQVLNTLPTHPTLQLNLKFQPSSEYLFTYVVWIFLPFLVYSVAPHYLLSLRNEDIIFDPGICKSTFSRPDISHRYGTVKNSILTVKENPKKDKIRSKADKNGKCGEAEKSRKQLQWIEEEILKKTQKEGREMQTHSKFIERKKKEGHFFNLMKDESKGLILPMYKSGTLKDLLCN
nr:hypothetical protein [Tanacetum cinerariifolium]